MRNPTYEAMAILALATAMLAFVSAESQATEIELRAVCHPAGRVVTLGDLAEIYTDDQKVRDELLAVEMFPAPAAGQKKIMRAREIQDLLVMRGLKSAENRLAGASEVEISGAAPPERVSSIKATTPNMERQANEAVRSAIQTYLATQTKHDEVLDVKFDLDDGLIRALDTAKYRVHVRGGSSPWTGSQQFQLTIVGAKQSDSFLVDADVSIPPSVVVATRSMPVGTIVNEGDVKVQRGKAGDNDDDSIFSRLEDVVGQEISRSIAIGQPLDRDSVERPRLVKRGDAVTVFARSAGLRVRTVARAREDGAEGDLISLESLANRQTFFGRVTGNQEVEIYARAPDAASAR